MGIALASHAEAEGHLLLARDAGVRVKGGYGPLQRELAVLRLMIVASMRTLRRRIDEERAARDEEMAEPEHDPVDSSTP